MSHVVTIKSIKDLAALDAAARQLGMKLAYGQTTYKWYGRYVGDYQLPEGYQASDLGKCDHAIVHDDGNAYAYQIGVVSRPDGKYDLLYDFWAGGYGLEAKVGPRCQNLVQLYETEVATKTLVNAGYRVTRQYVAETGQIKLAAMKY